MRALRTARLAGPRRCWPGPQQGCPVLPGHACQLHERMAAGIGAWLTGCAVYMHAGGSCRPRWPWRASWSRRACVPAAGASPPAQSLLLCACVLACRNGRLRTAGRKERLRIAGWHCRRRRGKQRNLRGWMRRALRTARLAGPRRCWPGPQQGCPVLPGHACQLHERMAAGIGAWLTGCAVYMHAGGSCRPRWPWRASWSRGNSSRGSGFQHTGLRTWQALQVLHQALGSSAGSCRLASA